MSDPFLYICICINDYRSEAAEKSHRKITATAVSKCRLFSFSELENGEVKTFDCQLRISVNSTVPLQ